MSTDLLKEELDRLTSLLVDGQLSDADRTRLAELLEARPELHPRYLRLMALHAHLDWMHNSDTVTPLPVREGLAEGQAPSRGIPPTAPLSPSHRDQRSRLSGNDFSRSAAEIVFHPIMLCVLVAFAAACVIGISLWHNPSVKPRLAEQPSPPAAVRAEPIARLVNTADAVWKLRPAAKDDALMPGQRLHLASGLAEIAFASGTRLILEGPAVFVVGRSPEFGSRKSEERNSCALALGRLTAVVPPAAHGFTVHTPAGTVTDLGTEFGVWVRTHSEVGGRKSERFGEKPLDASSPNSEFRIPNSITEVHVFRGKVEVVTAEGGKANSKLQPTTVSTGEGVVLEAPASAPRVIRAEPARFVHQLPPANVAVAEKDSPLQPGDILAVSRFRLKLVKIDPRTGERTLLLQGARSIHGTHWMCTAVDAELRVLIGVDFAPGFGGGVLRFDPRDGSIAVLAQGGILANGRVSGMAVAPDGTIFATLDGAEDYIVKIDPASGVSEAVAPFGDNAWGIAIDIDGRGILAASDGTPGFVERFDGPTRKIWVQGEEITGARGIAVLPDGRVLISITNAHRASIAEIDRRTHRVTQFAPWPEGESPLLGMIATEANGNLIVGAFSSGGKVYRVDALTRAVAELSAGEYPEQFGGVAVVPGRPTEPIKEGGP